MSSPFAIAAEEQGPVLLEVQRFIIEGANPLSQEQTNAVLKPYLGPHRSLDTLEAAAGALQEAIRAKGYSFHRVIVPAQQPAAGDLILRILPFTLGQTTVVGNKNFNSANILRSLPGLKPGVAPNLTDLSQQITLANEHPSKRLTLQIKEGAKPDTVDADIRVLDVPPSQFFVGLIAGSRDVDNTVNSNTGYSRVTLGYQHSNLFDLDHQLTLAYTTSPDHLNNVQQYGAFYTAPIYPLHTIVSGYYTKSNINSGVVGIGSQSFGVSGSGEFYGIKGTYALPKIADWSQNVSVGIDQRYFESNVAFAGTPLPAATVGSRPVSLGYSIHSERAAATLAAHIEYVFNTGGGRSNNAVAYLAARGGATRDWEAWRLSVDATYPLPASWTLKARLRAQYSSDALIPGEQLGIAGLTGVRGFREREVTGDQAYFINIEAHGPAFMWDVVPIVFYDQGARRQVTPIAGVAPVPAPFTTNEFISSAGVGLRWQWQRLEASVLWAYVLNGASGPTNTATMSGQNKGYLSLFYRF